MPAKRCLVVVTLAFALFPQAHAESDLWDHVEPYADFRFRVEQDWDSRDAGGVERPDRGRARIRARLGFNLALTEAVTVGVRLRSGSDLSQQSPHITILDFNGGDTGDAEFNLDKWFLRARTKDRRFSGRVGRDGFPFWKQNELFWDDDVTLAGMSGTFEQAVGEKGRLSVHAGWFSLPIGMRDFTGDLGGLQVVYTTPVDDVHLTLAGGYFAVDSNPADPDADPLQNSLNDPINGLADDILLNGDAVRDYRILVGSVQAKLRAGQRPLIFGADYITNRKDYSAADPLPFTASNFDQTKGHVFSASYGSTASRGDWLAAYYHARIETLAVIASYAQDDWVRWGNGPQTRGSNFRGHEVRLALAATRSLNVVARLYIVDSITTVEDGNRFRVDLNYKLKKRS